MFNPFTYIRDLRTDLDTLWEAVAALTEMHQGGEGQIGFEVEDEEEYETVAPPFFEVTDLPEEEEEDGSWIECGTCGF